MLPSIFIILATLGAAPQPRPNLIFVLADDLGYGDVGCFGSDRIETPNLDRLAASGMRWTRFYAASAVCTPTRASCLTGRYPLRFGITRHFADGDEHLPAGTVTLPHLLQARGYATAHVGKWHLGGLTRRQIADRVLGLPGPLQHGFDHYLATYEEAEPRQRLLRTRRLYRDSGKYLIRNDQPAPPTERHWTDYKVDESLELIERYHREGRPFFLNLWFDAPHTPYEPAPEPYLSMYKDRAEGDDLLYRSMVTNLDAGVGRIVAKLHELGIAENTFILFTSDNGPSYQGSPGPWKGGKADLHEGGIRVPMIASWPGRIPAGSVCDSFAHTNDLLPTFCAAAGLRVPADVGFDGLSLLPQLLEQAPPPDRGTVFWQLDLYEWYPQPGGKPEPYATEVARRGRWKLLARDGVPGELIDLAADPRETHNVIEDHPDVRAELKAELDGWRKPRAGQAADGPPAGQANRPNILFIYTDDQSFRTVSCYQGRPWVRTPNLDRLAEQGVRFNYAYGAAWCAPSRASVMTGLYPHAIRGLKLDGVFGGRYDPAVCRFWPAVLRQAGYRTSMIGKWHIGPDSGHGRDWDHSVVWDQADIRGDWYNDQVLSIDGAPKKVVPGYSTDVYTGFAIDEIRRAHDRPWFLWLCYNAPHLPNTFHPRHKDRYEDVEVPIPPDIFGPRPGRPEYMQAFTMWKPDPQNPGGPPIHRKQTLPQFVRDYNRLVCALDEGVGRILEALSETGQLDNTLIVYTSDQGFAIGERGFAWKVGPYEACMRMPLIVRLPGRVAAGGVCDQPVGLVDLPPTFFAMAGVPLPWTMHGHDLQPLLKDPRADWDHALLLEHFRWEFGPETDRGTTADALLGGVPWWIGLWKGRYKYVRTLVPDEIEELYDIRHDPDEMRNLALQADHRPLLIEYRDRMMAELERTEAGLLKNLPAPRELP